MTDKLQQAITAIKTGHQAQARQLLVEIIKAKPSHEMAWLWLSAVVTNSEQQRQCLQKVLKINPNNSAATYGLQLLEQQQASQPETAVAPAVSVAAVTETSSLKSTRSKKLFPLNSIFFLLACMGLVLLCCGVRNLQPSLHHSSANRPTVTPTLQIHYERSFQDRTDEISGYQVHVMYVLPSDGVDEELDIHGVIQTSVAAANKWLEEQTGQRFRLDTFGGGKLDVTFFKLSRTGAQFRSFTPFTLPEIEIELQEAGFSQAKKIYLIYYGGSDENFGGQAARPPETMGNMAILYLYSGSSTHSHPVIDTFAATENSPSYWEFAAVHEMFHLLGAVPSCAPHYASGHITDDPNDLMASKSRSWYPILVIDKARDDYFGHTNSGCLDISKSIFLDPLSTYSKVPPGWNEAGFIVQTISLTADNSCLPETAIRPTDITRSATIKFANRSHQTIQVYWLDPTGSQLLYSTLDPDEYSYQINSFTTHRWLISDMEGQCKSIYEPPPEYSSVIITD